MKATVLFLIAVALVVGMAALPAQSLFAQEFYSVQVQDLMGPIDPPSTVLAHFWIDGDWSDWQWPMDYDPDTGIYTFEWWEEPISWEVILPSYFEGVNPASGSQIHPGLVHQATDWLVIDWR